MKKTLISLISLLFFIVFANHSQGKSFCDPKLLYQADEKFFINLPGFQATEIKETKTNFLGTIRNKERVYKNLKVKLKVRVFWGENLMPNWQDLVLNLLEIDKNDLKDEEINEIKVKVYEKGEKKVVIIPVLETPSQGFLILFSSKDLTLENLKNLTSQFPIKDLCSIPEPLK
ncbi:hypothetical protein F1847_02135 [Thermodesulfobacterium sp. TA1]|uniref:hypothetical protein n=1 Tax=Thermodesulfobacterium sp. TA1 TaxID=2234087 RepID=UPI001231F2F0|nr:hypothetical protein [Thermodesulfobacterium sp. TA1]QER41598.1 hypothetical protein F1847_02135 [Thermodesulfobacterium sp. TA1]